MKDLFLLILIALSITTFGQPSTEIYVFDLIKTDTGYHIQNPTNVTYKNPGYDNQPHFRPDGSLYYVSTKNGQTDVAVVELKEYSWTWLTGTTGNEYSPTPIPGADAFSAINLEEDGTQLLWKYPLDFSDPSVLVSKLKIGYHCWLNESTLFAFVLGEPVTLQKVDIKSGEHIVITDSIGRSLHKIPNSENISYINKANAPWEVMNYNPATDATEKIINTLDNSEDMCWSPDGTIFMGRDSVLYKHNPKLDTNWVKVPVTDNSMFKRDREILNGITRLAISPDGKKIAIVVED